MSREPTQQEIDEADLWALAIREAQMTAVIHGTAFLKFTFVDQTIHVECLRPEDYMPWGLMNTMETKQ